MTDQKRDDAIYEFGHAVAARLRRLPWFSERWPHDEMEGFNLFHDIADAADTQLKELLRESGPAKGGNK